MNYLSHYYIDHHIEDPYYTLGTVLPDLHKGFSRLYNSRLKKVDSEQQDNQLYRSLLQGINRHYEVDATFHNSRFFAENVEIIKRKIIDRIPKLQRAYFAAHVLLEMLIDRQIILEDEKMLDQFYHNLGKTEEEIIDLFFGHYNVKISSDFYERFDNFLKWQYLYQYIDTTAFCKAFSRVYIRAVKEKLDTRSFDTLTYVVGDMDEILKHKWRNTFNQL